MKSKITTIAICIAATLSLSDASAKPKVHTESGGFVVIEAEDFHSQSKDRVRKWITIDESSDLSSYECEYHAGASNGSYIKILPDTRRTHQDELIRGENFAEGVGDMAVVSYKVNFITPGRYYVWVSCFSTNSEDNGVHVGIDGTWAESGQRMQWCVGKNSWFWGSAQRTELNHCGVPGQIWIDVLTPGVHSIEFSMREDGFAMDRFVLSKLWNISKYSDLLGDVFIPEGVDPELIGVIKVVK